MFSTKVGERDGRKKLLEKGWEKKGEKELDELAKKI